MERRLFLKSAALAGVSLVQPGLAASPSGPDHSANDICYLTVAELIKRFSAGTLSPVDVLKAQIDRIDRYNPKINCITYRHFDQAMAEAKRAEERYRKGNARPLEGITIAVKDENERVGWRITAGSLINKDAPPVTENSAMIDFLEAAGAVMHIQTTVPEFYLTGTTSTRLWGTTTNPWNLDYTPGGSSGGSAAALAAGFTTLATGSDMGGSIREPASQCGLYGFKPPFGRVATTDSMYESQGPMARGFDDLVRMQNVIVGPSPKVPSSLRPRLDYPLQYDSISTFKIAVDFGKNIAPVLPSVEALIRQAIERLRKSGCRVDEVDCGFSKDHLKAVSQGLMSTSLGSMLDGARQHPDKLTPYMRQLLDQYFGELGPKQLKIAGDLAVELHKRVQDRVFGKGYDVLLMPTVGSPFILADTVNSTEKDPMVAGGARTMMTWPWNLLGQYPVMDAPLGFVEKNMPTGMQIIGNTFDDLSVFRFAANWEKIGPKLYTAGVMPTFMRA